MKIFFLFFLLIFLFLRCPCTLLPLQKLIEAGETIRIHLEDEANDKIVISYTTNQKISITIDKFIPKVNQISTYLSNVFFSEIHYANTSMVIFFNMNVDINNSHSNEQILLKFNNLACYLYIKDMYFIAKEDKSFSYGIAPTVDRVEINLKEIKDYAIFNEIFENDMQIFKDKIKDGFIKHINRVLSKYPVGTVKSLANLLIIQLTEEPYSCIEEGVTKAVFSDPEFLKYNGISSQYGEFIDFSVTVTYYLNDIPFIHRLNLYKILVGVNIGFWFKEGSDSIGQKVLIKVMTRIFKTIKEKNEEE